MSATDKQALIVVDMLNPYEHEDAEQLTATVEDVVSPIHDLVDRAEDQGVEVIYVNDNYGHWTSSRQELVDAAVNGARPDLVEPIVPGDETAFVIKARHSIFYSTPPRLPAGTAGHRPSGAGGPGHRAVHPLQRARRLRAPPPGHGTRDAVAHIDPTWRKPR